MKNLLIAIASTFLFGSCSVAGRTSKLEALRPASVVLCGDRSQGLISSLLFGANIEWTENGNGIFDPETKTLRSDIVADLAPLRILVFRFPGGILSDYYHWTDGVGPSRPLRNNPMDGVKYVNTFGTDELIQLCQKLKAQPLITANVGSGSVAETVAWQRYFREKNLPVRYWEIGNEIYMAEPRKYASIPGNDARIYKTPAQYAVEFREYSQSLHAADGQTLVGAIAGTDNTSKENRGWLNTLIAADAKQMDFVSLHNSFAPIIVGHYDYSDEGRRVDAYLAAYAHVSAVGEDIAMVRTALTAAQSPAASRIAITEHFPLFGAGGSQNELLAILDQSRTMAAAVYTASLFHTFMRQHVWMAEYNLAVSKWFGALLLDNNGGLVRSPVWQVFDLYRNHFGDELLEVKVDSPTYSTESLGVVKRRAGVPFLDAVASRNAKGLFFLAVVNRHPSAAIQAAVNLGAVQSQAVKVWTLAARSANSVNGTSLSPTTQSGSPDSIQVQPVTQTLTRGSTYSFPPTSVTVIEWRSATDRSREGQG